MFSKTDKGIGNIEDFQMEISLLDETPVKEAYMNKCLGDMAHNICEPYLDDALCYGWSFEEQLKHLELILK